MFSRIARLPLAQGSDSQTILADVPIARKNREPATPKFYWKSGFFSSRGKHLVDK